MPINWTDVLKTIGGDGVLVAAVAWFGKQIITNKLVRDVEVFKNQLQMQADTEMERLRHSFQLVALEHQVRFTKLHEKRAAVIEEVYKLLIDLHAKAERFSLNDGLKNPNRDKLNGVQESRQALFLYLQPNRIYLPESVCASVENLGHGLFSEAMNIWIWGDPSSGYANQGDPNPRIKAFNDAWLAFEKDIPEAKRKLENEFRGLLGVSLNDKAQVTSSQGATLHMERQRF